mmetsp:Transcript_35217/g.58862  ORF Transcript_35217/g.58862 Transcript_35217/m.58862 type:complete len:168 (-) Transcript_35217:146-649(-)
MMVEHFGPAPLNDVKIPCPEGCEDTFFSYKRALMKHLSNPKLQHRLSDEQAKARVASCPDSILYCNFFIANMGYCLKSFARQDTRDIHRKKHECAGVNETSQGASTAASSVNDTVNPEEGSTEWEEFLAATEVFDRRVQELFFERTCTPRLSSFQTINGRIALLVWM